MQFGRSTVKDINSSAMGWVLIIFSPVMLVGALLAWIWLPEVQESRVKIGKPLPSKTLETLAAGRGQINHDTQ
jgi:hypothetical protein